MTSAPHNRNKNNRHNDNSRPNSSSQNPRSSNNSYRRNNQSQPSRGSNYHRNHRHSDREDNDEDDEGNGRYSRHDSRNNSFSGYDRDNDNDSSGMPPYVADFVAPSRHSNYSIIGSTLTLATFYCLLFPSCLLAGCPLVTLMYTYISFQPQTTYVFFCILRSADIIFLSILSTTGAPSPSVMNDLPRNTVAFPVTSDDGRSDGGYDNGANNNDGDDEGQGRGQGQRQGRSQRRGQRRDNGSNSNDDHTDRSHSPLVTPSPSPSDRHAQSNPTAPVQLAQSNSSAPSSQTLSSNRQNHQMMSTIFSVGTIATGGSVLESGKSFDQSNRSARSQMVQSNRTAPNQALVVESGKDLESVDQSNYHHINSAPSQLDDSEKDHNQDQDHHQEQNQFQERNNISPLHDDSPLDGHSRHPSHRSHSSHHSHHSSMSRATNLSGGTSVAADAALAKAATSLLLTIRLTLIHLCMFISLVFSPCLYVSLHLCCGSGCYSLFIRLTLIHLCI